MTAGRCLGLAVLLTGVTIPQARAAAPQGLCDTARGSSGPLVLVLSAFPAEGAPLLAAGTFKKTVGLQGRNFYPGVLEGVHVVLGLTGIGMVNAAATTEAAIRSFKPTAIVMSGVAGSSHRIADVVVASHWVEPPKKRHIPVNAAMLALARRGAAALPAPLEHCATVPPGSATGALVCMPFEPEIAFADLGQTSDPYGGSPVQCVPGGGFVIGCDIPAPAVRAAAATPEVEDMETGEVARVARTRGIPFVAMRAVSDGAGDPKGDRGFPAQFFDYYQLSADNAAIATRSLLAEVARLAQDPGAKRTCTLLARRRWAAAAKRLRTPSASTTAASQ